MNTRLGKLMDAAQPEPPTAEKFISAPKKKKEEEDKEACDNDIFPHSAEVSDLEKKPKGPDHPSRLAVGPPGRLAGGGGGGGVHYHFGPGQPGRGRMSS